MNYELKKNKKINNLLFAAIVAVFAFIFYIVMFVNIKRSTDIAKGIVHQFMLGSANEQVQMVNFVFDSRIKLLTDIAYNLVIHEHNNIVLKDHLNRFLTSSDFTFIFIVDEAGDITTKIGNTGNYKENNFTSALNETVNSVKINKNKDNSNETQFIFTVPFSEKKTIVAGYNAEKIYNLLNLESFEGSAYSYICDSKGNIIIDTKSEKSLAGEIANFFDRIENLNQDNTYILSQIVSDFEEGKNGFFTVSQGKEKRVVVYNSIGINDWIILDIIDMDIIENPIKATALAGAILIVIGLICIIFPVVFVILTNKRYLNQIQYDQDIDTVIKHCRITLHKEPSCVENKNKYEQV